MLQPTQSFEQALARYDRSEHAAKVAEAEQERNELLKRFPRDHWPAMTLSEYALGQEVSEDTFCRWMEFKTSTLGSIRGGTARKLIVYKHKEGPGWYFPKRFRNEQEAWEQLRSEFIRSFELAEGKAWAEIDELETLAQGPALKLKTLYLYFPTEIIPIFSTLHLKHLLRRIGAGDSGLGGSPVQLNRSVLERLRSMSQFAGWTTKEMQAFLYGWADPREAKRVYKIAPGEGAKFWEECLEGGYICVGWDRVGDLEAFDTKDDLRERFREEYLALYKNNEATVTKKANELWSLRELEPGDLVFANQGTSKILAVGEVLEPAYQFRPERADHKHTVRVQWDTRYAKGIPAQKRWALVTVAKVQDSLVEAILSGDPIPAPGPSDKRGRILVADPLYPRIGQSLERKGQVILYGPPGTGKTYAARRFAVWWLLRRAGDPEADRVFADSDQMSAAERSLSSPPTPGALAALTYVTFHPSYSYEDFIEGFRPAADGGDTLRLRLEDGVFKRVCRAAQAAPDRTFLLLVDEINRGNVAKVLGELLTLLERDKRGLEVVLPQSKERFTVPPNVYLLGTMNTADRSIKLLDAALRRRFAFIELMPDIELFRGATVGELALDEFLEELNRRIAAEEGREKQIGHAYLLEAGQPIADAAEFAIRFREEILPLLQEYCYDEYGTLARYIGAQLVDSEGHRLNEEKLADPEQLVKLLADEFSAGEESEES